MEQNKRKSLEKMIYTYLSSPSSFLGELDLVEELSYLFIDHPFHLNITPFSFEDYVIKSDSLNYVRGFLNAIDGKYMEAFDLALKNGDIYFLENSKKKKNQTSEIVASYQLKDGFELVHYFFEYWIKKNHNMISKNEYFIDTFTFLAEFLFQDYLENLGCKNKEPYYFKMNRFIYVNVFALHMMVELKLIELYQNNKNLESKEVIEKLSISEEEQLAKNFQVIVDDILSMNQISLPYHKRYLYGILFASLLHQKILKQPKLIQMFCYLIDHPEPISVPSFMESIGIPLEEKKGKLSISRVGFQELKRCYLNELEDSFGKIYRREKSR